MSFLHVCAAVRHRVPAGGAGGAGDARHQRSVVPGRDLVARPSGERATARAKLNDLVQGAPRRRDRPARLPADGRRGIPATPTGGAGASPHAARLARTITTRASRRPKPTMTELAKETESKLSELATTIELNDRGGETRAGASCMLSDIGREKMEHVRTPRRAADRARDARRSRSAGAASTRRSG